MTHIHSTPSISHSCIKLHSVANRISACYREVQRAQVTTSSFIYEWDVARAMNVNDRPSEYESLLAYFEVNIERFRRRHEDALTTYSVLLSEFQEVVVLLDEVFFPNSSVHDQCLLLLGSLATIPLCDGPKGVPTGQLPSWLNEAHSEIQKRFSQTIDFQLIGLIALVELDDEF